MEGLTNVVTRSQGFVVLTRFRPHAQFMLFLSMCQTIFLFFFGVGGLSQNVWDGSKCANTYAAFFVIDFIVCITRLGALFHVLYRLWQFIVSDGPAIDIKQHQRAFFCFIVAELAVIGLSILYSWKVVKAVRDCYLLDVPGENPDAYAIRTIVVGITWLHLIPVIMTILFCILHSWHRGPNQAQEQPGSNS